MDTKLKFAPSFFDEEERCGYTVTTKFKKVWAVELDLFAEFDRVCRKYDLHYCAWVGTLLGAIRHKGFIPWDDDFDVCMVRDEFEKLKKVAKGEFREPYFFQTATTDKRYFCGYARLRNSTTCGAIRFHPSPEYNNGIYIDIYVLDAAIEDDEKLRKQLFRRDQVAKFIRAYYDDISRQNGLKKIGYAIAKTYDHVFYKYEDLVKKYEDVLMQYNGISTKYSTMTHEFSVIRRCVAELADLHDCIYQPFENTQILIPRNYDVILRSMYGDYMEFPPVGQRGTWHNNIVHFNPDLSYIDYFDRLKMEEG